jgi:hypothetical protein
VYIGGVHEDGEEGDENVHETCQCCRKPALSLRLGGWEYGHIQNAYQSSPAIIEVELLLLSSFSLPRCGSSAFTSRGIPWERRQ